MAETSPFDELMKDAIGKVSELESQARSAVEGLISGEGVDVHQAMIATEKASMAFEMALAVRNKAIQSYQSVMGMQF
jgi:flagellar hook-basal body complex protein FliE